MTFAAKPRRVQFSVVSSYLGDFGGSPVKRANKISTKGMRTMKNRLLILCTAFILLTAVPVGAVKVYKTRSEGLADVKVYETSSEGLADCIIYVTSSEGLASGDAKWYYVNSEGLADVKVYFASSEGLADKKVYFTKSEGLAKCDVDWVGYKKSSTRWRLGSCSYEDGSAARIIRDWLLPRCDVL
jgi:hypothetical protein